MIDLITDNLDAIGELCRKYGVRKLEVFGSAATGEFDPETSDIDLIVTFAESPERLTHRFLGLAKDIEGLLGYRVDLIIDKAFENPYFRYSVKMSRRTVFESSRDEAAA